MFASDQHHANPEIRAKLRRLQSLGRGGKIELSFRPQYLDLLKAFGNPHLKLPPVIHVAGTNGKGSVVATLRSILEAAGYKVHAYTSPHLVHFNERIVLAGNTIDDTTLENLIDEALKLNNGNDVTFFEITTALAFAAFARNKADILLLETGLGGRLDCTNVVEKPAAAIITSIGLDHVEYLGDTYGKIAGEKAGIMKRGVPVIVAPQSPDATKNNVIETLVNAAQNTGAPLLRAGADWFTEAKKDQLHFVFKAGNESVERILPLPNLLGAHQIGNAGSALAALEVIKDRFPVPDDARASGLQSICHPGRLQNITSFFGAALPPGWDVFLDGAHNDDAARVLSTQAALWQAQDGKPLYLVLAMMDHKDPAAFIAPLLPHASAIAVTSIPGEPRALPAAALARRLPVAPTVHDNFAAAVHQVAKTRKPGRILLTGSLYLVGRVLNYGTLNYGAAKGHNKVHDAA